MNITKKRIATLLAVLLLLVGGALLLGALQPTALKVTAAQAGQTDLSPQIFGIGVIEAHRAYLIGPTQASRLSRVLVDHGDRVKVGQLLAELDPVDLDERLTSAGDAQQRAASSSNAAAAQVREAESRNIMATSSAKRFNELRQKGFVSQEAFDAKQHEADAAKAALEAAQAALSAAQRDVARLAADRAAVARQRAFSRLVSPVDGLVTAREVEPGSTVVAGQAVLRLIDPASLWIKARIDQSRANGIVIGQTVRIVLRSRPQEPFSGKVARIEASSDSVTEERLVEASFDNLPENLSIGELAEVTILLSPLKNVLALPSAAIRHRTHTDATQQQNVQTGVWRIAEGRVTFVPVRVGAQTLDGRTQILDGLTPGETVIHHAAQEPHEGDRVRIVEHLAGRES